MVSIVNFNYKVGKHSNPGPVVVSKKIFSPELKCAIVFVASCLALVSFHRSSLVVQSYRRSRGLTKQFS